MQKKYKWVCGMIHLRNLIFLCRLGFAFVSYLCIIATLMNQLILSLFQREPHNKLGVGVGGGAEVRVRHSRIHRL